MFNDYEDRNKQLNNKNNELEKQVNSLKKELERVKSERSKYRETMLSMKQYMDMIENRSKDKINNFKNLVDDKKGDNNTIKALNDIQKQSIAFKSTIHFQNELIQELEEKSSH